MAAIFVSLFAIIGFRLGEHTHIHKPAAQSNNDRRIAVVNWSEAACHQFKSIAQVTDCDYSAGGFAVSYVAVTLAMDSEDAVRCPAFAAPHPISSFEMRIKLAATGAVSAMCKRA